ncbi:MULTISPECIES: hypothetical protein [unclassified Endozoicomonas]
MKQGIRLVLVLVTMMLPCTGYSGDDRYDAYLPLAELALMQMFKTFIGGGSSRSLFNLEEVSLWSFNRDHHSSDGFLGIDEQTVDGELRVTARFQITAVNTPPDMRLRPSNFIEMGARSKAYFTSVLQLLTEYFRTHFNTDKVYYLGRANLDRNQGSAVVEGPDYHNYDSDYALGGFSDSSDDEGKASEEDTEAGASKKKYKCYDHSHIDVCSLSETPEYWDAEMMINMKKGTITYKALLLYSGFLRPAFGPEPSSPKRNDSGEEYREIGDLIEQTRQCIDLYNGGLDEGLSEYLPHEPTPPS